MDLMLFYTGDTDTVLADYKVSVVVERYWEFTNMTRDELGVTDGSTRHIFLDQSNSAAVWDGWRLYRAIFET